MRLPVTNFSSVTVWTLVSNVIGSKQGHKRLLKVSSPFLFPTIRLFSSFLGSKNWAIYSRHFSSTKTSISGNKMADIDNQVAGTAPESPPPTSSTANDGSDRSKCIFCKIADGKEQNEIFYQDDEIVVFQDIKPAAKHHLLVVTREHIRDCKSLLPSHLGLLERLVQTGEKVLLQQLQLEAPTTQNLDQIQTLMGFHWPPFHTVAHLHLHVIAPSNETGFIARTIFRPNSFWFVTADYVKERLEKMAAADKSQGST